MKGEDLAVIGAAGLVVAAILYFTKGQSGTGQTPMDAFKGFGAYIPTLEETAETGITAGSLFNTGQGGGYLSGYPTMSSGYTQSPVKVGSLFNTGDGGGFLTNWNATQPLIGYSSARDR